MRRPEHANRRRRVTEMPAVEVYPATLATRWSLFTVLRPAYWTLVPPRLGCSSGPARPRASTGARGSWRRSLIRAARLEHRDHGHFIDVPRALAIAPGVSDRADRR